MAYNGRYTSGIRLMLLRDFFYANASRTHAVKPSEIRDFLTEHDCCVDRRTLYHDISTLQGPGFDMALRYNAKAGGYFLDNPPFEPSELQLIIDSLNASRFITGKELSEITAKVQKLADKHTRPTLNRPAVMADRIHNKAESVMKYTGRIYEAMAQDVKISFQYFHYAPDKNKEKTYSKQGAPYIVSPFALFWSNGNYYLYAYNSDRAQFWHFRVDRMESIRILPTLPREGKQAYNEKDLTHKRAVVFDMYSGPEYQVRLRVHNRQASAVIDKFGKNIMMVPDDETHFTVTVPVEISPPFFAWVATFGRSIKILGPEPVVEGMKKFIGAAASMYEENDMDYPHGYQLFQNYKNEILKGSDPSKESNYLLQLIIDELSNAIVIEKGTILYRARKNKPNQHFQLKSELGMNKTNPKNNRASPEGISYLYVAEDADTAIAEIQPNNNDIVTVAKFTVCKPLKLLRLHSEASYSGSTGARFNSADIAGFIIYLSIAFASPVQNEEDYLPCQYFAGRCRKSGFNGIQYISAQNGKMDVNSERGFNFALFSDENVREESQAVEYEITLQHDKEEIATVTLS